jgi:hypothetical protein
MFSQCGYEGFCILEYNDMKSVAVFLDIAQALDRVWQRGLLHKLRSTLPDHIYLLLKSYLTNQHFCVRQEDSYSELKLIKTGVPQGSVLGSVLYLLYIKDVPTTSNSTMATFADDTTVMAIGETVDISTRKLQSAVNKVAIWKRKWRIKLNKPKSVHIDFTNNKIKQPPSSSMAQKFHMPIQLNILV